MHPSPFPLGEEVLSVESLPNLQKGRGGGGVGCLTGSQFLERVVGKEGVYFSGG